MKTLHPKIKALQLRANPVNYSNSYIDESGELRLAELDLRVATDDKRTIKGYLFVWNVVDTYRTVFVKGCFAKSIREHGPQSSSNRKIAFLWQHKLDDPAGRFTKLEEDDYGLYFEAECDDVPTGERMLRQVRSGTINQFSGGFNYIWDKMEYEEERDVVLIKEAELMEGSGVTIASIEETHALRTPEQLNSLKEQLIEETEEFIKSIPRSRQLELRQLFTRHNSLARREPLEQRPPALETTKPNEEPVVMIGGYKLNTNQFL
jgi:uncharacterized protein